MFLVYLFLIIVFFFSVVNVLIEAFQMTSLLGGIFKNRIQVMTSFLLNFVIMILVY
jgi:hypothetical protein